MTETKIFRSVEEIERYYLPNKYREDQENTDEMTPEELVMHFGRELEQKLKLI
jgi:hypothetical protein